QRRHDAIWVVVDHLTKSAHFLPIRKDYPVGERVIEGPEMIDVTNEKVAVAKEKLKEARTRQKSYADKHRRSIEFQPGDRVFLRYHLHVESDASVSRASLVLISSDLSRFLIVLVRFRIVWRYLLSCR
nr:putative reverse transcriptase domain-containing protein [Tanacetum cinerariifolium]